MSKRFVDAFVGSEKNSGDPNGKPKKAITKITMEVSAFPILYPFKQFLVFPRIFRIIYPLLLTLSLCMSQWLSVYLYVTKSGFLLGGMSSQFRFLNLNLKWYVRTLQYIHKR